MIDPVKFIVSLAEGIGIVAQPDAWRKEASDEGVVVSEVARDHIIGNGFDPTASQASIQMDCRAKGRNRAVEIADKMKVQMVDSGKVIDFNGGTSHWDNDIELFRYSFLARLRV